MVQELRFLATRVSEEEWPSFLWTAKAMVILQSLEDSEEAPRTPPAPHNLVDVPTPVLSTIPVHSDPVLPEVTQSSQDTAKSSSSSFSEGPGSDDGAEDPLFEGGAYLLFAPAQGSPGQAHFAGLCLA